MIFPLCPTSSVEDASVHRLAWCATYARHLNVLPLACSHALGTPAILCAFDPALTGRLRIGYSYLLLER